MDSKKHVLARRSRPKSIRFGLQKEKVACGARTSVPTEFRARYGCLKIFSQLRHPNPTKIQTGEVQNFLKSCGVRAQKFERKVALVSNESLINAKIWRRPADASQIEIRREEEEWESA